MKLCNEIRTAIACGDNDAIVNEHMQMCDACRRYASRVNRFESHIESLVKIDPPAELTARLLAIAADHAMPPVRTRQPWWSTLMAFVIGVIAVITSVLIMAELVVLLAGPMGFGTYASEIVQLPMALYTWMRKAVPSVTDALATIDAVRVELIVMLTVMLVLFGWYGQRGTKQRKN